MGLGPRRVSVDQTYLMNIECGSRHQIRVVDSADVESCDKSNLLALGKTRVWREWMRCDCKSVMALLLPSSTASWTTQEIFTRLCLRSPLAGLYTIAITILLR